MANLFFVRNDDGKYSKAVRNGGFIGVGWLPDTDLSSVNTKEEIAALYNEKFPEDNNIRSGIQVGQITRFLLEIKEGDYILTSSTSTAEIYWGMVTSTYYYKPNDPNCPYAQRKKVEWRKEPILRSIFSVPFQNSIRSSLSVFRPKPEEEFFSKVGLATSAQTIETNYHDAIVERILRLDAYEFELLTSHLLSAMGFEAQHTGRPHDGGVDITGTLDMNGIAQIQLVGQVKRYQRGSNIKKADLIKLRQNITRDGQGVFITTSDFRRDALEAAVDPSFPRIGTINGHQLVDLLEKFWNDMPEEAKAWKEKLGLRIGLVY